MLSILKNYLFQSHYNKIHHKPELDNSINRLSSVTILSEEKACSIDQMKSIKRFFEKKGVGCDGFLVVYQKELLDDELDLISPTDVYWYGVPKQEALINWLQHKTDLLIMINPNDSQLIRYLCASSNSLLKSAITKDGRIEEHIDFSIDVSGSKVNDVVQHCQMVYNELVRIHSAVTAPEIVN